MIIFVTQLVSLLKVYFPTLEREEGQGMVEYALIIALVAVVIALLIPGVTGAIGGTFDAIITALGGGGA
jgi:pilus assembly protein Flp/PilA